MSIEDVNTWINNNYSKCFDKQVYTKLVKYYSKNYKINKKKNKFDKEIILAGTRIIVITTNDDLKQLLSKLITEKDKIIITDSVDIIDLVLKYPTYTIIIFNDSVNIEDLVSIQDSGVFVETIALISSKEWNNNLVKHIICASQGLRTFILDTFNITTNAQLDIVKSIINGEI